MVLVSTPHLRIGADAPFTSNERVNTDATGKSQNNPSVAVNSTGTIFIAWEDYRNDNYDIYFANSTDNGITWSNPSVRINTDIGTATQNSPSVAVGPSGEVYVAWADRRNGNPDVYFANSSDGGAQWSDPNVRVNTGPDSEWQTSPSIAVGPAGVIYAVWEDKRGGDFDIYFAKSTNGGATWTDPNIKVSSDSSGADQRFPSIGVDGTGRLFVAYQDDRAGMGDTDIYFSMSSDGGTTWSNPDFRISDDTGTSVQQYCELAVTPDGHVYVAWEDFRDSDLDIYLAKSADGGLTWPYPNVEVYSDSPARPEYKPDVAVGKYDTVYVTWIDGLLGDNDVHFTYSLDDGTTWKTPSERVNDDLTNNQWDASMAVGPNGILHVAWEDDRNGDLDIFTASRAELLPPSPYARGLTVDGFQAGTPGIMHVLDHEPVLKFTYRDIGSDPLAGYNVSVWNEGGSAMLWWCNRSVSLPPDSDVTERYNTSPCPANGQSLVDGTSYMLRVRVGNSSGAWGPDAQTIFHLNSVPEPTSPVVPANNSVIPLSLDQELVWTAGADPEGDAVAYHWEVASDTSFGTVIASGITNTTNSTSFTTSISSSYYWRVRANDTYEDSAYGNQPLGYWQFSTSSQIVGNIIGSVKDGDGAFIADAKVELFSDSGALVSTTSTNGSGEFAFQTVQVGNYTVKISKNGFETYQTSEFELLAGETESLGITLKKGGEALSALWLLLVALVVIVVIVLVLILIRKRGRKPGAAELGTGVGERAVERTPESGTPEERSD